MKKLHLLLTAILLCSVSAMASSPKRSSEIQKKYEAVFQDDSRLTPAQLTIKRSLRDLITDNVSVKNGKIVTSLKKRDFRKRNIPVGYYDMLRKSLDDINTWIDKGNITPERLETLLKESFKRAELSK